MAEALALILVLALVAYALLAGADFGAGIWQALKGSRASPEEREQIHAAVGPVWEANHVWLIFVLVLLHTAFPPAVAAIGRALWMPLSLALVGIVFRGAGFAFRPREPSRRGERRRWEGVFGGASVAAPFFLGCAVGAVASGSLPIDADGAFHGHALSWVSPFSLFVGVLAVATSSYLAATYLARESFHADRRALHALWRRRAIASGVVVACAAAAGLAVMAFDAPRVWDRFRDHALALVLSAGTAGVASLGLLLRRRHTLAAAAAALAVATLLWGGWLAQSPTLIPPHVTIDSAKAPDSVLAATLATVVGGAVLTAPALWFLLRVFKSAYAGRRDR